MPDDINRFGELVSAIKATLDQNRFRPHARETARDQGDIAMRWLVDFSPEAIPQQTVMTTGHDHETIKGGWRGPHDSDRPDGAEALITNLSEHVDVQRSGTSVKNYVIAPRGRTALTGFTGPAKLSFWLGPPLIWPVRKPKFRVPGFVEMTQVTHPGFGPHGGQDFVERAADRARPEMTETFHEMAVEVAFEPIERFFD
jgi:hypothetical protein